MILIILIILIILVILIIIVIINIYLRDVVDTIGCITSILFCLDENRDKIVACLRLECASCNILFTQIGCSTRGQGLDIFCIPAGIVIIFCIVFPIN